MSNEPGKSKVIGEGLFYGGEVKESTSGGRVLQETANEVERAKREGFTEIEWDEAESRGPYLALSDGTLWRREPGIPATGRKPRDWRYAITMPETGPPGIIWLTRSLHPQHPETVAELDEREKRKRETAAGRRAEQERRLEDRRKNPPARVLTLGDEDPVVGRATLRGLARRLEAAGGVLVVERDGGLTIRAALVTPQVVTAGQVLSKAAETILVCVKRKPGAISPEALPDAQLTLGGDLVPPKLLGRP